MSTMPIMKLSGDSVKRRSFGLEKRQSLTGWVFLIPAALLIAWMNFYPMIQALILSFHTGKGTVLHWANPLWYNFARLFQDPTFKMTITNTFVYLIIQVPIMLVLAMILATILNDRTLKFRGLWRTAIFLPCAVSLVSYAFVFRTLFATNGAVSDAFMALHLTHSPVNWLGNTATARMVIILGLLWRWTGYNMVFFLAGLQNIDYSTFEAAKLDGAGPVKTFFFVTVPQLKPMILLTAIMSTNGTLQLFDESWNLTQGGPANTSMTMSHYLYQLSFQNNPNIGYGSAVSYAILIMVAILAAIQMKVGDRRD
ncbi:MAG: sugar ABC transporter permease [Propionibacteriaceae bacterium]|nr:sugar ABC transporter permease [Propionibacteriaceae bacterium]